MQYLTGKQYLQIEIANNYGLDKKKWKERIQWVEDNETQLESLLGTSDTPALYYASVQAYRAAQRGEHVSFPTSLDATTSGLQLLACLTGDRSAASLCNVVPVFDESGDVVRQDGYTVIYRAMTDELGEEGRIQRDDTKKAIMTSLYGSKAQPKRVFGTGILLRVFEQTMAKLAPYAWQLNQAFLDLWDPEEIKHSWVLPDNFHVHVKVMDQINETVHFLNKPYTVTRKVNAPVAEGRSLGANTTHSIDAFGVREVTGRCDYDPIVVARLRHEMDAWKIEDMDPDAEGIEMVRILWDHYTQSKFLSVRIINYLNQGNMHLVDLNVIRELLDSMPAKPFKVLSVHDCFRVLPNYCNDLRWQYTLFLSNIAKSDLLQFILRQSLKRPEMTVHKADPDMWKDILETEYALS